MERSRTALPTAAAAALMLGVGAWAASAAEVPQDPKSPITIWTDGNRSAQANAYKAAHPEIEIKVEVIGSAQGEITSKVGLAVKAGSGIPDVVFLNKPDEITTLTANPINFPIALNDLVPKDVIAGFPSLGRCTYDGKIYCLANDTGQTVLWYNKVQFKEWGYAVPKTFDEFKALGAKLVAEHPGYNLGTINGRYGVDAFFGSSGCPVLAAISVTEARINLADPKCTRVGDVIGPMIANGSLSTLDLYDKNYTIHVAKGETIAMVGASWVADFAFKPMTTNSGTDFDAKGKFAAAPMPMWAGETTNWSGAVGGGTWVVSSQTKNRVEAIKALLAMTTAPELVKTQTTYPGYIPNAKAWLAAKAVDPWYAEDPSAVLTDALTKVNAADAYTRYQTQALDSFNKTVLAKGATDMAGALKAWGDQVTQAAEAVGYTVIKK
jgi:multiple sugar transport system substrate-binding protein